MRSRMPLILALALLAAGRCLAEGVGTGVAPQLTPINAAVDDINGAIRGNQDDGVIRQKADMFAEGLPATRIGFHVSLTCGPQDASCVQLHPWREETDLKDTPADVGRLYDSLQKKFALDDARVPPPTLNPLMRKIQDMNDAGLIQIEKSLDDNTLGENHTTELDGERTDWIGINKYLPYIAMRIGDGMAAAVLCHEAGHASDPNVMTEGVVDREVIAFQNQYDCIKQAFPTGEELGTMRLRLRAQLRQHYDFLTNMASQYLDWADTLYGTGGDPSLIRKRVAQPLYSNGEPRQPS